MYIQLSNKVQQWLGFRLGPHYFNDIYAWHLNYTLIERKKFFVLMHNLSRFTIVLYPVTKKDLERPVFLYAAIYNAFINEGYDEALIDNYFNNRPGPMTFATSSGRWFAGRINHQMKLALDVAKQEGVYLKLKQQLHLSKAVNKVTVNAVERAGTIIPREEMLAYLNGKEVEEIPF